MDAIDFSTWLCNDSYYLSLIYSELGNSQKADYFKNLHESIKAKINEVMWCEEDGLYYDVLFDGKFTHVATPSSFFPMLAGICSQEQADKMVKVLLDENRFWTKMPVPSMPKDSEFYDIDMWRGCSWLNLNYFIIVGLRRYGFVEIAEELRKRTLDTVFEWYQKTGNVFEFYDADNKICPLYLKRKGEQPPKPDYREHVHSITDYNWSACFTELLILNKF
jgi:neutral trehalase